MSNDTITLKATKREVFGKKVRGLRDEGLTPAVVHDHGKQSLHISIEEKKLKQVYSSAGKHHPVVLDIDGKNYTTLIKEVTLKPAKSQLFHTVFQAVKANEKVKAEIPVHLVGEVPAEKASLLVLKQQESVEVEALPKDLVDVLEVSAESLEAVGDKLTVADLKVPEGVEVKTDPETVIATVEMPKDQVAEADAAKAEMEAESGAAEPTEEASDSAEASADSEEKADES